MSYLKKSKEPKPPKAKKVPKKTEAQLKKELWSHFATFIKNRDGGICFTCGKKVYGYNYQAGHFIMKKSGGVTLYFHEDNVHGQCSYCNLFLDGEQYKHGIKIGTEKVAELYSLKGEKVKNYPFEEKIEYYKKQNEQNTNRN